MNEEAHRVLAHASTRAEQDIVIAEMEALETAIAEGFTSRCTKGDRWTDDGRLGTSIPDDEPCWRTVDVRPGHPRRWHTAHEVTSQSPTGRLYGWRYDRGNTEDQEDIIRTPLRVFQKVGIVRTETVYVTLGRLAGIAAARPVTVVAYGPGDVLTGAAGDLVSAKALEYASDFRGACVPVLTRESFEAFKLKLEECLSAAREEAARG